MVLMGLEEEFTEALKVVERADFSLHRVGTPYYPIAHALSPVTQIVPSGIRWIRPIGA